MAEQRIVLDIKKLNRLIKGFEKVPEIRIGIMGEANARSDGKSNATIGAFHEFGLGVPQRSFLRQPLIELMPQAVKNAVDKTMADQITEAGSLEPLANLIAEVASVVVNTGFDTGGYGKWVKWKPGYTSKTGNILQDTQQLRDSITTAVILDK